MFRESDAGAPGVNDSRADNVGLAKLTVFV